MILKCFVLKWSESFRRTFVMPVECAHLSLVIIYIHTYIYGLVTLKSKRLLMQIFVTVGYGLNLMVWLHLNPIKP